MAKVNTQIVNPYSGISTPGMEAGAQPVRPNQPGDMSINNFAEIERYQQDLAQYNADMEEWTNRSNGVNSDGSPIAPDFVSMIDPETGRLKDAYQLNAEQVDASGISGMEQFEDLATGDGLSQYGQAATDQLDLKTKFLRDQASKDSMGAQADAMSQLQMRGGMSSGARERVATGINAMDSKQGARQAQLMGTADIGMQDASLRSNALGQFTGMNADIAQYNTGVQNQQQEFNIGQALNEMGRERDFTMDKYGKDSEKWAAGKKADAERASGGGGGGCCFIFLEARYGNGTMDEVVRMFRDANMTDRNKRGYYKLSEVLVPLMRKSKVAKFLVRTLMTDPLVSYGKYHYGRGKLGKVFTPVKNFWLKAFDYLGQDHKFVRENGEVI